MDIGESARGGDHAASSHYRVDLDAQRRNSAKPDRHVGEEPKKTHDVTEATTWKSKCRSCGTDRNSRSMQKRSGRGSDPEATPPRQLPRLGKKKTDQEERNQTLDTKYMSLAIQPDDSSRDLVTSAAGLLRAECQMGIERVGKVMVWRLTMNPWYVSYILMLISSCAIYMIYIAQILTSIKSCSNVVQGDLGIT